MGNIRVGFVAIGYIKSIAKAVANSKDSLSNFIRGAMVVRFEYPIALISVFCGDTVSLVVTTNYDPLDKLSGLDDVVSLLYNIDKYDIKVIGFFSSKNEAYEVGEFYCNKFIDDGYNVIDSYYTRYIKTTEVHLFEDVEPKYVFKSSAFRSFIDKFPKER